jgi:hypothetical protein
MGLHELASVAINHYFVLIPSLPGECIEFTYKIQENFPRGVSKKSIKKGWPNFPE